MKLRVTRVRCDRCGDDYYITTTSERQISESRWDLLLVEKLRGMGWSAGLEPTVIHRRIPPDICPSCNTKKVNTPTKEESCR